MREADGVMTEALRWLQENPCAIDRPQVRRSKPALSFIIAVSIVSLPWWPIKMVDHGCYIE